MKPHNVDLALIEKKNHFKGKLGEGQKSDGTPKKNQFQGISLTRNDSGTKSFYCGKSSHIARNCYKKNTDEAKHIHKNHAVHFAKENQNNDLKIVCV